MRILFVAATAGLLAAGSAMAQTVPPAAPAQSPAQSPAPAPTQSPSQGQPASDVPVLPGAVADPTCGRLGLEGKAFCVTATLAAMGALAESYISVLEGQGWLSAGGDNNRVVFVRRRADGGGCDGMQMQAFYDTSRPAGPEAPGYLGFATIPGNVCAAAGPAAQ